jgi:cell division protein FtsA
MPIQLDKYKKFSKDALGRAKSSVKTAAATAKKNARQPKDEQYLVALDVGTENVKALVGKVSADEQSIEVIGVGREHQKLSDMQAGAIADIASVVDNCDKALNQAEQQAGVSVRTAMIGIAGELVKGKTSKVRCTRKDPNKPLDLAEMERIIKLVQQRAETKAQKELAVEMGGKDVQVRLVNSAMVSIEIDGYPVTNPIGFQGKNVVVHLYTAYAPMIHIGALERAAQELDLDLLAVAAEPFAVARSIIGDNASANLDAILMDVGGGTTDLAVIDDGGVQGTKMFGIGGRAYTKTLTRDFDIDFDAAEELKLGLTEGKLNEAKQEKVEKSLEKTLDIWLSGIELALEEFTQLDHLPYRVLLCGGGSSLDMLMEKLQNSDWHRDMAFTRKPTVQHIKPSQVVGITDTTGDVADHTFITALGLLRVGLDTMHYAGAGANTVKEKIDRMLRV